MTTITFAALCSQRLINPAIALESDAVREALARRDDKRVIELLDTEF